MKQGEQEYPPGTVGYLAQGLGWGKARGAEPEDTADPPARRAETTSQSDADAAGLDDSASGPEQPADQVDVHTDEDDDPRPADAESPTHSEPSPNGHVNGGAAASDSEIPTDTGVDPASAVRSAPEASPAAEAGSAAKPASAAATTDVRSDRSSSKRPARWVEPGALAAAQAQRDRIGQFVASGSELESVPLPRSGRRLPRPGRRPPRSGWRRVLYSMTGGSINLGEGPADVRQREQIARINHPLHGCHRIAMLSLKGGVGKTTVTATLGATFAALRGDRVIAVDANPDRGTLSQKIPLETSATVRHLLRDAQRIRRYTDVRAYTSQGPSRLEVLASEQDPAVSEAFSEQDYRRTVAVLEHFYNLVLTDCGTGLMHSAMYGVLGLADSLVIVSSGSIDGARSASATMDWLDAHGHGGLVANSVAVINAVRRSSGQVDLDRVAEHFAARCRAVIRIPFDSHLEEGTELDLNRLAPATRNALLELAATVADAFPGSSS